MTRAHASMSGSQHSTPKDVYTRSKSPLTALRASYTFASTYSTSAPHSAAISRALRSDSPDRSTPTTRCGPNLDKLTVSVPRWHCKWMTSLPVRSPTRCTSAASVPLMALGSSINRWMPYPEAWCSAARSSQFFRLSSNHRDGAWADVSGLGEVTSRPYTALSRPNDMFPSSDLTPDSFPATAAGRGGT